MKKPLFKLTLIAGLCGVTLILIEVAIRLVFFRVDSFYDKAYTSLLKGEPKFVAQPYLNYTNNPRFIDYEGRHTINHTGIKRTEDIAFAKEDSVYRIIFLGGSTTFGEVENPDSTYPALLEKSINSKLSNITNKYSKVECLNCGLPSGTSAEILTHYAFKLSYLKANLVVIHAGLNDAATYLFTADGSYQPDYGTCRAPYPSGIRLSPAVRCLFRSKAVAYFLLRFVYNSYVGGGAEENIFFKAAPEVSWFTYGNDSIFSPNYNAFYNNVKNVITLAKQKQQAVLLVTEVINPVRQKSSLPDSSMNIVTKGLQKHTAFMQQLSVEYSTPFCQLPDSVFTENTFLPGDVIHLNGTGEALKAQNIEKALSAIIAR